ncbi:biotin--[acetyl-CoA-carboxylase] ligase [Streptomyces sp. AJS327]|uniref:biotin--[acetyl-CoA-carboxylase] ligase n=1 Tax=Streptomyces sp. AJS327 TaxID=2545265 RepID=UPI0015DEC9E2|nr:biotin--[acetyl-CoA-carboxylase] ligase [Streptomyces sp. AJS327]MBA0054220.1 biotin--[acetyl-CoA-carboxylase] ligase [Streptomyces sp. AJS327]
MAEDADARSRWSDLDRPPLNAAALRRALVRPDGLWTGLSVLPSAGSTNTELAALVRAGEAAEGTVLVAEEQTAGRGRLDRRWNAPPRSGIFFSAVLTPRVPPERWGWLPLLAGVATATALSRAAGVDTALKWPNDLLLQIDGAERKFGGILAERADPPPGTPPTTSPGTAVPPGAGNPAGGRGPAAGPSVVLGIGLNVSLDSTELPVPTAGSLRLAGALGLDRDPLLRAVLRSLEQWYVRWTLADGDPGECHLLEAYAAGCVTLGRAVRAELPGGDELVGEAVAVDGDGRLVLATEEGVQRPVGAGDIVHLRPAREDGGRVS